jgi:uncharacterized protein (TIGR02996 family)
MRMVPMNHDLANLFGAIRQQPNDKLAFLALADWCLEQPDIATQARGEHVRLSAALNGLAGADFREARSRLTTLEKRWRAAWLGPLRDLAHRCDFGPGGLVRVEVTHGRISDVLKAKITPPTDEQFGWVASLVARAASLDDLRWMAGILPRGNVHTFRVEVPTNNRPLADVLSGCAWLSGLRTLELSSYTARLADSEVVGLAGLSSLSDLTGLNLCSVELGTPGCSALAHSPHLGRLCELALPTCGLAAPQLRALLTTAFAPPLVALSLEGNEITPQAARILAGWPTLATVSKLTLDRNPLGDDGLAALARSPYLGSLRDLRLQQCGLTTTGLKALAGASLGQLQSLDLCFNDGIGDAGLLAVARSSSLSALCRLWHGRDHSSRIRARTIKELNVRFAAGHNPRS